jgi:hypothetical protein
MITKKNIPKFTTVSSYEQISERGNSSLMTVPKIMEDHKKLFWFKQ